MTRGDQFSFEFSIHFVLENLVSLIQQSHFLVAVHPEEWSEAK
jgi:hypothetical protein